MTDDTAATPASPAPDPIAALAAYLTGPLVVRHSVALGMGGLAKTEADAFFDLRRAWGVHGYAKADEARVAIARAIGDALARRLT
jgi:hypothetical protein